MTLRESSIPDAADLEANVRWLRDVELIKQLVQRYVHGVDTLDDLRLGLRYQDDVVRAGSGWKIIRRNVIEQWHRGPFPRPSLGPPIYPRPR